MARRKRNETEEPRVESRLEDSVDIPTQEQVTKGLHEAYWKLERRVEDLEKRLGKT